MERRPTRAALALLAALLAALALTLGAAQEGGSSGDGSDENAESGDARAIAEETMEQGATLFADNCAACHQSEGQGIEGVYPALAGNEYVTGEVNPLISTLLNGRGGMPSFGGDLDDEQIATVLTYIRNSWDNQAPPITAEQVATVRGGGEAEPVDPSARPGAAN